MKASLRAQVTSRAIANVSALTNKRKLAESSTNAMRFDMVYTDVKSRGYQAAADRFISVLLKLKENPSLLALLQKSNVGPTATPKQRRSNSVTEAPAHGRDATTAGKTAVADSTIGSRIPSLGSNTTRTAAAVVSAGRRATGSTNTPERIDRNRAAGALTETTGQHSLEQTLDSSSALGTATPLLASRGLALRQKKGESAVPTLPDWTRDRPFLTGDFLRLAVESPMLLPMPEKHRSAVLLPISTYPHTVQQLVLMEELLSALMGIEGKYIKASVGRGGRVDFRVDITVDASIADLLQRILPLASCAHSIQRYVEVHSRYHISHQTTERAKAVS
eukprot:SAG31_NODE_3383_length_4335_cov_2.093012_1_plen_334_part_00